MKEKKANFILQIFFKVFGMDGMAFNGVARYATEPENASLEDRLHEAYHLYEQKRDGLKWYIRYFTGLVFGYSNHKDEQEANEFAMQKIKDKSATVKTYIMTDKEYVQHCYKEATNKL